MATRQILADLAAVVRAADRVPGRDRGRWAAWRRLDGFGPASRRRRRPRVERDGAAGGRGPSRPGSRADFARSGIAMAVRSGAPRPSLEDEDVGQAGDLGARAGSATPPGRAATTSSGSGSGGASPKRLRSAPCKRLRACRWARLVAQGEADLGFQQLSELLHVPGIEIVGPLPPEIQAVTVFAAGISTTSSQPDEARALVAYLTSPETRKRRNASTAWSRISRYARRLASCSTADIRRAQEET